MISDPLVMAGPLLQPIRGMIFTLAFYPIRSIIFARPYGWLILWWILIALGVLGTFGPAPRSIEGMIYTTVPFNPLNVKVELQALALASLLWTWVLNPQRRWLGWLIWSLFAVIVTLISLGLMEKAGVIAA